MSFADLTRARYSCRSYEDRAIEPEKLAAVVEAGRIAPSAHNNHPTRIVICDTPELKEKAAHAAHRFAKDGSIFGAPVVILACARTEDAWVRRNDGMNSSLIDTSIRGRRDDDAGNRARLGNLPGFACSILRSHARSFGLPEGSEPVSMLHHGLPSGRNRRTREARSPLHLPGAIAAT